MTKDYFELLYNISLRYVSGSTLKTAQQVKRKLDNYVKKHPPDPDGVSAQELVTAVLDRLQQDKLINDVHYASTFVQSRTENPTKLKSRLELQAFLMRKGVDRSTILEALKAYTADVEADIVRELVEKKKTLYDRQSLRHYLIRRGFTPKTVDSYLTQTLN